MDNYLEFYGIFFVFGFLVGGVYMREGEGNGRCLFFVLSI